MNDAIIEAFLKTCLGQDPTELDKLLRDKADDEAFQAWIPQAIEQAQKISVALQISTQTIRAYLEHIDAKQSAGVTASN